MAWCARLTVWAHDKENHAEALFTFIDTSVPHTTVDTDAKVSVSETGAVEGWKVGSTVKTFSPLVCTLTSMVPARSAEEKFF